MDIFHHNLKTIEEFSFGILNCIYKIHCNILIHDSIRRRKKRQYMFNEMLFICV